MTIHEKRAHRNPPGRFKIARLIRGTTSVSAALKRLYPEGPYGQRRWASRDELVALYGDAPTSAAPDRS